MIYIEYFDSGRIHTLHTSTKAKVITASSGSSVLQVDRDIDFDSDYVDVNGEADELAVKAAGALAFDVATIDADLVDTATISGIPAHTLVTWPDGEVTEINDGVLEFAVDLAGTYTFTIDSVAHLIQEVSIEALATA